MVVTSHDQLGDTGRKTGAWLEEIATPYYVFRDAGTEVTLASPKGGQAPVDPSSEAQDSQTENTRRFEADPEAKAALASTRRLDEVSPEKFDAVFYPGGHGPLWDLAEDRRSVALIESFHRAGKPTALVCHGPGALRHAKSENGKSLVAGKAVTGFTNTEEDAAGLSDVVPFKLEDELKRLGARYEKGADWQPHLAVDGNLITGQNPASSGPAAEAVLEALTPAGGRASAH